MNQTSNRSGVYVKQATGYKAFVPKSLPPTPTLEIDDELLELLSAADRAIGRLDGSTEALPNPDLFVMMYVHKEALLSSQIEGTQASLAEVLEVQAEVLDPASDSDVAEVLNYIVALNYGIQRLETLPLSLRLICEIHEKLMEGTRGQERHPGAFRNSQNWIGPQGCSLNTASFVPPAPEDMKHALAQWEDYVHDQRPFPFLLRVGMAHAQFETIHPFLDGNGRVGRLLITFLLYERLILKRPLLYLSHYFKQNRLEYYDRLQAVRDKGDWEGWLKFFLRGIAIVANEATDTARKIVSLRERQRMQIQASFGRTTADALNVYERLFEKPYVSVARIQEWTGKEFPAANKLASELEKVGILELSHVRNRSRIFRFANYLGLFDDSEVGAQEVVPHMEETISQ